MYQRNQTESAMFHFQHLLDRNPNQYHALSSGDLSDLSVL